MLKVNETVSFSMLNICIFSFFNLYIYLFKEPPLLDKMLASVACNMNLGLENESYE